MRLQNHERAFQRAVQTGLGRQYREVIRVLSTYFEKATGPRRDVDKVLRQTEGYLHATIKPQVVSTYSGAGQVALDQVTTGGRFNLAAPEAVAYAKKAPLKFARKINNGTRRMVRRHLARAIDLKEGMDKVTERMKGVFSVGPGREWRARRIARTETNGVMNRGQLDGWRQSRVVRTKIWLAGFGARDWHAAASGQEVPFDEPFTVMGERLQHPGDGTASPANRINCRCTMMPGVGKVPSPQRPKVSLRERPKLRVGERRTWTKAKQREWEQSLSYEQIDAIDEWKGSFYRDVRAAQAGKERVGGRKKVLLKNFESALRNSPRYSGTVYRGVSDLRMADIEKFKKCDTIKLQATSSATVSKGRAKEFAGWGEEGSLLFKIRCKTGTDIRGFTPNEKEILLMRGSRYKVVNRRVRISKYGHETLVIELKEITGSALKRKPRGRAISA
jgi:hypothetical protein